MNIASGTRNYTTEIDQAKGLLTQNSGASCHERPSASLRSYAEAQAFAKTLALDASDAAILICAQLQISRASLFAFGERVLSTAQAKAIVSTLQARAEGVPVAYLLGYQEFYGLRLKVNADVLIPRADTETLVDTALAAFASDAHIHVLDLGTGSGAIALALKQQRPKWRVSASDASAKALLVARENARVLGLDVEFLLGDWLTPHQGSWDLIVANPPYIDASDPHLSQGDLRFEPSSALVAAGCGLADLAKICQGAALVLRPGAWLMLEHGFAQAPSVQAILSQNNYQNIRTIKDLAANPRVSVGQQP
jgi:release factor glutamine methyltransferase